MLAPQIQLPFGVSHSSRKKNSLVYFIPKSRIFGNAKFGKLSLPFTHGLQATHATQGKLKVLWIFLLSLLIGSKRLVPLVKFLIPCFLNTLENERDEKLCQKQFSNE